MVQEIILDKTNTGNKPHYYIEHIVCVGKLTTVLEYRHIWNYRK